MIDPVQSNALSLLRTSLGTGGIARLRIDGESMRPTLRMGDIVILQSFPVNRLRIGDLLVMQRGNDLVTHRLVAVRADGWYTKGDASTTLDTPASDSMILGRVEAIERGGSSWSTQTKSWMILNRFIGWLAWQEVMGYRNYRQLIGEPGVEIKWWARLLVIPFRLPLWLLAAFRR